MQQIKLSVTLLPGVCGGPELKDGGESGARVARFSIQSQTVAV